ncbi:hypothetical protein LO762_08355 [Actinocorallia sp. API 0066]|uniref:hypothetical protein n=1 Tax=Actinocorallia sp. API 0066 TaxID=2896846 RepID=UPI001E4E3A1D|nr:hypothetical protein [Actinocorallia sp. API 0066]MCD0449198.1 hypothetical protein [Actinocorallia sp. API 0066]
MATPTGLGRGLALRDGDLVLDGGRLAEVAGPANLAQALTLRVLTPLGSDRYATTCGFDAAAVFTGAVGAREARDLLRLGLVRALGADPRVREIRDVTVLAVPGGGRRLWRAEVTVLGADGAEHALAFEVEV